MGLGYFTKTRQRGEEHVPKAGNPAIHFKNVILRAGAVTHHGLDGHISLLVFARDQRDGKRGARSRNARHVRFFFEQNFREEDGKLDHTGVVRG